MNKYSAINIGPVVSTITMGRKPRELWAASYLFSFLMECIYNEVKRCNHQIISPSEVDNSKLGVGLLPDRLFFKGESNFNDIRNKALEQFIKDTHIPQRVASDYFKIMYVSVDANSDSEAVKKLNNLLDCLELCKLDLNGQVTDSMYQYIKLDNYRLFDLAYKSESDRPKGTVAEYAASQFRNHRNWKQFVNMVNADDERDVDAYKLFGDDVKSYHKYICVVQADGDNVGKTVSHPSLVQGKVLEISQALLQFGKNANEEITTYGGLPIYAGGDDLLFLAPVVGLDGRTIFQLMNDLNNKSFKNVIDVVNGLNLHDDDNKLIRASLSFGVSVTYYKYPLYEALESARHQLFDIAKKKISGKHAVAIDWRKHSGGSFSISYSKSNEELEKAFHNVIQQSAVSDAVVSSVSHKIRSNEGLLKLWLGESDDIVRQRTLAFFKKYIEYKTEGPEYVSGDNIYKESAMNCLCELFKTESEIENLIKTMYGMIRIAKFVSGEEVRDE